MTIRERVLLILEQQTGVPENQIKDTDHLIKDLKADSLDVVEVVMSIEEVFELDIPDEVAETRMVVGDMIRALEAL